MLFSTKTISGVRSDFPQNAIVVDGDVNVDVNVDVDINVDVNVDVDINVDVNVDVDINVDVNVDVDINVDVNADALSIRRIAMERPITEVNRRDWKTVLGLFPLKIKIDSEK